MQLFYSPTSPYARKCRALIVEKSLEDKIELVEASPLDDPEALLAANPLGKVPALIRKSGPALIDSPLICEFIDSLDDERWIPARGESRTLVLRQQAIADGLMDLTIGRRIEKNRDTSLHYPLWIERWERAIARTLEQLDRERGQFERSVDHGALSIAVALSYLDLRYGELDWRSSHPELGAFLDKWEARESLKTTAPPAGV
jgi:glutathione S-transferase